MRSPSLPASATACDQQCVSPVRCVLLRSPHRPPLAACDQQRASPVLCFLHRSPHRPPCATNSVPRRCVASCIAMDHSIGGSLALPDTIGGSYRSEGREFESLCSYLGALRQSIFFCRCLRRGGLFEFHSGYSSVGRASDCRLTQRSDGPWFDSGWPDFPRLAAGVAVRAKACGNASAQLTNLTLPLRWSLTLPLRCGHPCRRRAEVCHPSEKAAWQASPRLEKCSVRRVGAWRRASLPASVEPGGVRHTVHRRTWRRASHRASTCQASCVTPYVDRVLWPASHRASLELVGRSSVVCERKLAEKWSGHPLIEKLMGLGTPLQISNSSPLNLKVCCCVPEKPGHTSAPAGPTPPAGPCVWRLLRIRCAPTTVRLWVTHIRTVAGLLPGAQLGMMTAAAPTICQPSSTASTVAILAQGTKWADALPQAFFQTAASDSARGREPGHPPWEFSGLATCNFYLNGCLRSRSGEAPIV